MKKKVIVIKHRNQKGFFLIELMIMVTINSILVASALPAYQDYTKRTRVTEGLSLAAGAKCAIAEYWASTGSFPVDNAEAGVIAPTYIKSNGVLSITIAGNKIIIAYNTNVAPATENSIVLTATPGLAGEPFMTWDCKGGSLPINLRPAECRP